MKPSDFLSHPMDSVSRKSEAETVARNIMVILSKTGNTFRPFGWDEYRRERLKDGNFSQEEQLYFDQVIGFCQSNLTAQLFSPEWEKE